MVQRCPVSCAWRFIIRVPLRLSADSPINRKPIYRQDFLRIDRAPAAVAPLNQNNSHFRNDLPFFLSFFCFVFFFSTLRPRVTLTHESRTLFIGHVCKLQLLCVILLSNYKTSQSRDHVIFVN